MGVHGIVVLADKSVAPDTRAAFLSGALCSTGIRLARCLVWEVAGPVKLWVVFSSCIFNFSLDGGVEKSSRVALLGNGGEGWWGPLLGLGCRRVWEMLSVAPASPPASVQVMNRKVQSVQVGENITFSCRSVTKEDVIQVTWQKETDGAGDNIATYSTMNGQKIAKAYVSHVSFAHSELQASAISFHGVTLQDEGCYKCIFNTFPSGAVTGRMCLKVYGKAL